MNVHWDDFLEAVGCTEDSLQITKLVENLGELPEVSSTHSEYNDPDGETKFYQFTKSGVELGFRSRKLSHAHFFLKPDEGYSSYQGPLPNTISVTSDVDSLFSYYGNPEVEGGGSFGILGYVRKWVRYDFVTYALRFELSDEGFLQKITIIGK
ncbi:MULTISPECIES: hypothetical protein [unclassified Luteibacter]|uniref:hypothetical protein n=1 Tax=Luteibacter sp. PvP019 TaxID=3156436 RepID=UPI003394286C